MSPHKPAAPVAGDAAFSEIVALIRAARTRAYQAVNTALIDLYWQVGQHISRKLAAAEWGDAVVAQLAAHLGRTQPGLRGFTRANLFRMRQVYEAYCDDEEVASLVRQLPWTHNLIVLSQSRHREERAFYLRTAAREQWSKRELERQFAAALFERVVLSPAKVSPVVRQSHPQALGVFKDSVRKPHENPAIGVLLCASKDDEVVEYALSRTASPALIAEYQTQLPDKALLQAKLHEFYQQDLAARTLSDDQPRDPRST